MFKAACLVACLALAAPLQAEELRSQPVRDVIDQADFDGDLVVSKGFNGPIELSFNFHSVGLLPEPWRGDGDGLTWRWASVTKQMVAILVMQQVERGNLVLDEPVATYLPSFASENSDTVTIRQLLQHQSGLPNPDAGFESSEEMPSFYRHDFEGSRDPITGFCAGPATGSPGGNWAYNNCDYMVLGSVLEAVTGLSWDALFKRDIAEPLGLEDYGAYPGEPFTRWGFLGETREPERDLSHYQASAGLYGASWELISINNALMGGRLLSKKALAEMWDGDPGLGFMALGQWVFTVPLKGCEQPVRIVERRGDIGAVQVRSFILPDLDTTLVAFSQRKPFAFGEVWMGQGFSYDLLSAAACPTAPSE